MRKGVQFIHGGQTVSVADGVLQKWVKDNPDKELVDVKPSFKETSRKGTSEIYFTIIYNYEEQHSELTFQQLLKDM